ncbi:hypothetical protein BKA61DRAFT_484150 [Leptodontidium sp. MPI-SDFR-AT-0119]|nr:hypothetical protein BKA61DRAFT_484150 [Leptodontidium sp. MPI-SDFR-AT-0119]
MASSNPEINVTPAEGYKGEDFVPDEIPEQLQDECLVNFFRCRYADRPALEAGYEKPQRGRIRREITRIDKLREGFEETDRNKPDIELFEYRKAMWRRHAIDTCKDNFNQIEARVTKLIASKKFKTKEDSDRHAKKAEEEAAALAKDPLTYLVEKVAKRFEPKKEKPKRPSSEPRETIDTSRKFEHPKDSYGISVHKITLKQSDTSCPSSYMSYSTDRYPLSEILLASDTNPLTEKCKPNTIRYFHFPANNMHWIEMPYLHWETHRRRKKMTDIMKEITEEYHRDRPHVTESLREELAKSAEELYLKHARQLTDFLSLEEAAQKKVKPKMSKEPNKRGELGEYLLQIAKIYDALDIEPDVRILRDHLHKDPPLHARRTLDQSFPRRWGRNKPDWSGVHKGIRARLDHLREGEIQSVYDMALLIMNQCSTVFFDRTKPVDERPEILDIFSNALSHVSGMKCISFESFWRQLHKLSSSDHQQADFEATARKYLNINPEGELLRETHDIIEELRMMSHIFNEQLHVVDQFTNHLKNLREKEEKKKTAEVKMLDVMVEVQKLGAVANQPQTSDRATVAKETADSGSRTTISIPESTIQLAQDVGHEISSRLAELQKLEHSTVYVSDQQLKDLLSLKQQQASIIEAKYALKRADESVTQGRSIMLFTIVTIIFLPLSFMSSVFGMNTKDLADANGNPTMSLKHIFKLLCELISPSLLILSLNLATLQSPAYIDC